MERNQLFSLRAGVSFVFFILLMFFILSAGFAGEEDLSIYKEAKGRFFDKKYEEALTLMNVLRVKYPESIKADDALWYIGRCQVKLGDNTSAIETFQTILNLPDKSNRYSEASLDLGDIYYKQKNYEVVISLLKQFKDKKIKNNDSVEIQLLLGKSYYMLGISSKDNVSHFLEADKVYTLLLENEIEEKYRWEALYWLGKTYVRLFEGAKTDKVMSDYKVLALSTLQKAQDEGAGDVYSKLDYYRKKVTNAHQPLFHVDLTSSGGTNLMVMEPGIQAELDLALDLPIGLFNEISLFAGISHTNFSKKTFNFVSEEIDAGDIRLLQMTQTINAGLLWKAGLKTPFRSQLKAFGEFEFAEDPEDFYISSGVMEDISYEFSPLVTAGIKVGGKWKKYPNYLINNRKLDSISIKTGPECLLTFTDMVSLRLDYEFAFKQYLDSKYDTETGTPATENKQYFTHKAGTTLQYKPWENIWFSLGYDFTYNMTQNYNLIINADPAPQYIQGYYDFNEHDINVRFDAVLFDRVKTKIKAGYAIRNYHNYEARDTTNTFIGELRQDNSLNIGGTLMIFLIQQSDENPVDLSIIVEGEYTSNSSNMTYEYSIDTNYDFTGLFVGIGFSYN